MKVTRIQVRCGSRRACRNGSCRLEYVDWWSGILKQPLEVDERIARVAGVIDSGIEFDEAAVERDLA